MWEGGEVVIHPFRKKKSVPNWPVLSANKFLIAVPDRTRRCKICAIYFVQTMWLDIVAIKFALFPNKQVQEVISPCFTKEMKGIFCTWIRVIKPSRFRNEQVEQHIADRFNQNPSQWNLSLYSWCSYNYRTIENWFSKVFSTPCLWVSKPTCNQCLNCHKSAGLSFAT